MYTLKNQNITPGVQLTKAEDDKLMQFINGILNGASPLDASSGWKASYKRLSGTDNQYQISLSAKNRVTFTVDGKVVTLLDVGGHT